MCCGWVVESAEMLTAHVNTINIIIGTYFYVEGT